jgi:hypothetical protein
VARRCAGCRALLAERYVWRLGCEGVLSLGKSPGRKYVRFCEADGERFVRDGRCTGEVPRARFSPKGPPLPARFRPTRGGADPRVASPAPPGRVSGWHRRTDAGRAAVRMRTLRAGASHARLAGIGCPAGGVQGRGPDPVRASSSTFAPWCSRDGLRSVTRKPALHRSGGVADDRYPGERAIQARKDHSACRVGSARKPVIDEVDVAAYRGDRAPNLRPEHAAPVDWGGSTDSAQRIHPPGIVPRCC